MSQFIGYFHDPGVLNMYAVILSGQTLWNGTGFENFNAGDQALYGIYMTDPNGVGYYTTQVPATLPPGNFVVIIYQRAGGSINMLTDSRISSLNLSTPQSVSIVAPVISSLVTRLRLLSHDNADSNLIYSEGANPPTDGTRTIFKLQNANITAGSLYWSTSTTNRSSAGVNVDDVNGIVTFTSAPADGIELVFDYTYEWFTDSDHQEFLNDAADILVYSNPNAVPDGLIPSLLQFGLYEYYLKRASSYAHRFSSSGGTASEAVSTVTGEFQKLANTAFKNGSNLRDNYYTRSGRQKAPAFAQSRTFVDPYTPSR